MLLIEAVMLFCRRGFESCSSSDWAPWCYLLAGQRLHFLQQYITGFHSDGCILHDIKQRQNKTPPRTPPILPFLLSGWESFASINLAHLESRPQRWRHEQKSPQTAEISQTPPNTLNASDALMDRLGAAGGGGCTRLRERQHNLPSLWCHGWNDVCFVLKATLQREMMAKSSRQA